MKGLQALLHIAWNISGKPVRHLGAHFLQFRLAKVYGAGVVQQHETLLQPCKGRQHPCPVEWPQLPRGTLGELPSSAPIVCSSFWCVAQDLWHKLRELLLHIQRHPRSGCCTLARRTTPRLGLGYHILQRPSASPVNELGDRILFCVRSTVRRRTQWAAHLPGGLRSCATGTATHEPQGAESALPCNRTFHETQAISDVGESERFAWRNVPNGMVLQVSFGAEGPSAVRRATVGKL
mmetsp:Transcript_43979/g.116287  ORF Transcript_43979/g.116287 Transcript_43979/m.116287 type:complete len:236 (-) Transcript_43979:697-1404(-)